METGNTFKAIALLSAFYLAGCASTYSRGIDKTGIKPNGYIGYFNKSQELVLFDKAGGLETELNSEWEKTGTTLSDCISDSRLNAEEIVTKDKETGKTTQEGIVFYVGPDGNKYQLVSSDGKYGIERAEEHAGGGGGGGGGGDGGGGEG